MQNKPICNDSNELHELTPDEVMSVVGGGNVVQSASGEQVDEYGTGFLGSESLENTYVRHLNSESVVTVAGKAGSR